MIKISHIGYCVMAGLLLVSLALSLMFRDKISGLLAVQKESPATRPMLDAVFEDSRGGNPATMTVDEKSSKTVARDGPAALPAYRGRDPEEVAPVPAEIQVFSETQRSALYASIRKYGKIVRETPHYTAAWIQLGILKKQIGDFEGAADAWEYAALIGSDNPVPLLNLGNLYAYEMHDGRHAEEYFKKAIAVDPKNPRGYSGLAEVYMYFLKEKEPEADDVLVRGLAALPDDVNLMKTLASLYERRGDHKVALEWWQKIQPKDPNNPSIASTIEELKQKIMQ